MVKENRPRLLKVKEVAEQLRVSRSFVYDLVEKRKIPYHRVGKGRGAIRISDEDVAMFVKERRFEAVDGVKSLRARRPSGKPLRHLKG